MLELLLKLLYEDFVIFFKSIRLLSSVATYARACGWQWIDVTSRWLWRPVSMKKHIMLITMLVLLSQNDRTALIPKQICSRSEIDTRHLDFSLSHWPWHVQRAIEVWGFLELSFELIYFIFVEFVCLLHFFGEVRCKFIGDFTTHFCSDGFSDSYFSAFAFSL